MQMLATATINPARYLGMDDLGSIETGNWRTCRWSMATLLEDVKSTDRITHVMVNGRLYRATDLGEDDWIAPSTTLWWHNQPQHQIR